MKEPLDLNDPNTRCCALVGKFLQNWALMESRVDQAIGKALGLDTLQNAVVCANVGFREKLFILKTAVSLSFIQQDEREKFRSILDRIQEYSEKRNMIAHRMFLPTDDGKRVSFIVTKATGILSFPSVEWGGTEFETANQKLGAFTLNLIDLIRKISHATVARALMEQERIAGIGVPKLGSNALTIFGLLNRPPKEPLGSKPEGPPSTLQKENKTRRSSQASKQVRKPRKKS